MLPHSAQAPRSGRTWRLYSNASMFGIMETLVFCCEGYASVSSGYRSMVCPVSSAYIDPTTTASGVPP